MISKPFRNSVQRRSNLAGLPTTTAETLLYGKPVRARFKVSYNRPSKPPSARQHTWMFLPGISDTSLAGCDAYDVTYSTGIDIGIVTVRWSPSTDLQFLLCITNTVRGASRANVEAGPGRRRESGIF